MATITNQTIELRILWEKDNPSEFTYYVDVTGTVPATVRDDGVLTVHGQSAPQIITRTTFRGLTGAQIETAAKNIAEAVMQTLGQGGHTAIDDTGD